MRVWLAAQEVDELTMMLQQAEEQKELADAEASRARDAIVAVNEAATRFVAAQVRGGGRYLQ